MSGAIVAVMIANARSALDMATKQLESAEAMAGASKREWNSGDTATAYIVSLATSDAVEVTLFMRTRGGWWDVTSIYGDFTVHETHLIAGD